MTPQPFPEANCRFGPPAGVAESQVAVVTGYVGDITSGSLDGYQVAVVAWKPDAQDLLRLQAGGTVFLTCLNGLPAHFLSTSFPDAVNPA